MQDRNLRQIEHIEKITGKPTGISKIQRGECPVGDKNAIACMLCPFGHILECHYPYTCQQAECSHYQMEGNK